MTGSSPDPGVAPLRGGPAPPHPIADAIAVLQTIDAVREQVLATAGQEEER